MTPHRSLKSEVGVRELHDQLSRYVQRVATGGGEVIVTSRGRPIARLAPIETQGALAELRARGIVSEPTEPWIPREDRPVVRESLMDLVAEQRR
jgi:prevent-host-death family protein